MKFTEHLGAHLTPEWRSQYIRYEVRKHDEIILTSCEQYCTLPFLAITQLFNTTVRLFLTPIISIVWIFVTLGSEKKFDWSWRSTGFAHLKSRVPARFCRNRVVFVCKIFLYVCAFDNFGAYMDSKSWEAFSPKYETEV